MITDNTAKWRKKKLSNFASNEALPVGFMYQHLSSTVPIGSLPLFGAEYDRSLYADLWSWANENGMVVTETEWQAMAATQGGSCAKFSDGNGSTTFRVPALKCWVKGASGVEEVGSYLEAGLPNITGNGFAIDTTNFFSGALYRNTTLNGSTITGDWDATRSGWSFDASKSNSIYGNSNTVQPPSIVGMYCIKAFGTISNVGNADVANVMQAVEQVQTGLGVVDGISDYIIESYRNGSEWYEVYKSGKVRQGGQCLINRNWATNTFLKPYVNTEYTIHLQQLNAVATQGFQVPPCVAKRSATQFDSMMFDGQVTFYAEWVAEGQGA